LRRDPEARPSGETVLRALGAADATEEVRSQPQRAPFVGRLRELDQLKAAFADSRDGKPVTVLVHGESGVGKSALVRQFLDRLRGEVRGAVVLAGRCYERESVPYKALDGVIDSLARWMMRIPPVEAAGLLPLRANLLAQVFPVLQRVEVILKAPGSAPAPVDPVELRHRTFQALRELFVRASARHPLAIAIDDLQWADADSLALLSEILHPPDAPSLLLIGTLRPVEGAPNLAALAGEVRQLPLDRLGPDESRQLVTLLAERTELGRLSADSTRAIADEARGHPLFIDELVRHAAAEGEINIRREKLHLEDALWSRIRRLEAPERRLLELVTVAGGPLPLAAAARAFSDGEPDTATVTRLASLLRGANLVRSSRGADEALEPYHDRVRASVREHLDDAALPEMHKRLALALEQSDADPETLSHHFHGAGDALRAAQYADLAAEQAARALAFERAVTLYRLALQLDPDGQATRERQIGLGEALATLGRCGDAALCFLTAAKLARAVESLELQRRASEQLLISGHIDEGLVGIRTVLTHFDLKLAPTPRRALASLLARRAQLRLRGLGFKETPANEVPVSLLRRIDGCWSVAMGLGMVDTIRAADFQTRHLLYALSAGEPYRIARALAMEAAFMAATGRNPARAEELLHIGRTLAEKTGLPHAIGMCELSDGVSSFLRGEWKRAHAACQRALEILRERCVNVPWELGTANQFSMLSLSRMGHIAEMSRLMPELRRSARERGNLYEAIVLRAGLMLLPSLAADDPAHTREDVQETFEKWSTQGFQMQHFWEVYSKAYIDLYQNDGRTALDRITARWPTLERSLILKTRYVRYEALNLRALASMATSTRLPPGAEERDLLIKQAEKDTRELSHAAPWAQAVAKLLEAGIAAVRGQTARAISLIDQAIPAFEAVDMYLYATVARRRRGELEGGPSGEALVAAADAWMAEQKIRAPRRMCALLAPGFPD
jgi:tetratricopeptide (TPR) repeat protein